jgi:hypothetical protein
MILTKGSESKTAALDLAKLGYAVFPIKPKDKTPATAHGFKDGTADPAVVEKMFGTGNYNVGIATGPASGAWVLDVEAAGIEDLDRLQQQYGKLPETVTSITGGGGRHIFFAYNGAEVKNRTKIGGLAIDVRGSGGYVVVPPSIHNSGNPYVWEHAPGSTPIVEAPQWLTDLVVGNHTSLTSGPALTFTVGGGMVEDLSTAPGVGKGQRHAAALKLVGSAIGRNVDLCQVAQQATAWAARCSPPIPDDEVLRIVSDLSQRQGAKTEDSIRQEVEAAPLPEPVEWPILDQAAYYGISGEIVRQIEPESEADPVAILVQLLTMFGNLIGRRPYYAVEGTSHHANLFAVLVGSTARGRKGTSEGRVRQILRSVDEEWVLDNIKTGCVSGEGIVWNVRDPMWGHNKKGEEVLVDEGIADKRLLIIEPEFAAVLRVCRRETNTLSPTLRSAWDSGILRTLAKNSPAKATDAHLSIIGHITETELHRSLTEIDGFNGFANRFLWVAVRRSKLLPDGGRDLDFSGYASQLRQILTQSSGAERLHRDPAAKALWRRAYGELADDDASGLLGAVTSRAEAQVLRLSMIYALLDGGDTITVDHLQAALALWRYCRSSAAMIFGDASGDSLTDRLLTLIRETPGISRNEIHRRISSNVKAAELVKVLARLRDAGRVRVEKVETGGKPAEKWFSASAAAITAITAISPKPTPNNNPLITVNAVNAQTQNKNDGMEEIRI